MSSRLSLIGQTFGKLKVIGEAPSKLLPCGKYATKWRCVCECGTEIDIFRTSLVSGKSQSCGCVHITHGHTRGGRFTGAYSSWSDMIKRCTNKNSRNYSNYGGRGITVCERWLKFENFLADMGDRPKGCSIERINNEGNYEPGNCRWATRQEQNSNTRQNRYFVIDGIKATMAETARRFGLNDSIVRGRIDKLGWDEERAFKTPLLRKA